MLDRLLMEVRNAEPDAVEHLDVGAQRNVDLLRRRARALGLTQRHDGDKRRAAAAAAADAARRGVLTLYTSFIEPRA